MVSKINTKYPDLQPEFYVVKKSKSIHMGLNLCLLSVTNNQEIISDIKNIFNLKNESLIADSFILYWLIQQNGNLVKLYLKNLFRKKIVYF